MTNKKTLYLIDGSSYIFRAFFAIRQNLSTAQGQPTNALYGFVHMLMKVLRDEKPDYLAVVFDTQAKTFRHNLYSEYKANRDKPPEELAVQFPFFHPLVEAFNIASLAKEGFEADDLIGTLARRGEERGLDVVIVSGDKDMMQLITPHIGMLDTMKGKRFAEADVVEKFGVPPHRVVDVMGLMGDASDNIPGVPGVGPKTAADLIRQFDSLDNLYQNLDQVEKKKLQDKLREHREDAFLSRKLALIDTAVPLDCGIEDLKVREKDSSKLKLLFEKFEFTSLLADLELDSGGTDPVATGSAGGGKRYQTILDENEFSRLCDELERVGAFALDLETDSKHPVRAAMVGISFCWRDNEAYYIPVGHEYLGAPSQLGKDHVLKKLKPILENPQYKKIGHNIKYDLIVLRNEGIQLQGIEFDSMIASYILDPSKRNHNMDDLAMELLQYRTITYKEVVGKGAKEIGFWQVDIERATQYAAEDADVTWLLSKKLRPLIKDENLKLFDEVELPLIAVLAEMEMNGVCVDHARLAVLSRKMEGELRRYEQEIYALAGEEFNINSTKQLAEILFVKLKFPSAKKTKTGFSTDISVLEDLVAEVDHELPAKIVAYRQLGKLKSTYVDALPEEVYSKTGRVHTSFNQTIAATGRLSSSDPNMQNIPIRSDRGKEIRKAFVASEGALLFSADYSQIELRILAHLSDDANLIRAFINGEDIHARTAAEILGVALNSVNENQRRMAKAVNFGIVYGLSAFGLSRGLKISPKEAKVFIDQYFNLYKGVKRFMEETVTNARKIGYTTTLFHRRRYLPDLNSKNRQVQQAAERVAINSPVQGSAADIIKAVMITLHKKIHMLKLKSKMILQVHDELLFECPKGERGVVESLVKKEMEGVFPLKVPLIVDTGWGQDWSEAH